MPACLDLENSSQCLSAMGTFPSRMAKFFIVILRSTFSFCLTLPPLNVLDSYDRPPHFPCPPLSEGCFFGVISLKSPLSFRTSSVFLGPVCHSSPLIYFSPPLSSLSLCRMRNAESPNCSSFLSAGVFLVTGTATVLNTCCLSFFFFFSSLQ